MTPVPATPLLFLLSLAVLAACDGPKTVACVSNPAGMVMVERDNPSALDGYVYRVCTAPRGAGKCTGHDDLTVERPNFLKVDLKGRLVLVEAYGGSVTRFRSDPIGMSNADYARAIPIAFSFHLRDVPPGSGLMLLADGQAVDAESALCR